MVQMVTVEDFAGAWAEIDGARAAETVTHNDQMLRPFVKLHGRRSLAAVDSRLASGFARSHPSHARYARTFMEDARRAGLIESNPFEGVPGPSSRGRRDITALTVEQVWAFADAVPAVFGPGLFAVRFRALVLTCAFSGVRECQAAELRAGDVDVDAPAWRLRVRRVKGSRLVEAVLPEPGAQRALTAALAMSGGGLVFRGQQGQQLNRWSIGRAFGKVRDHVGMPDVDFHELRHFFATWLVDRGASPSDVSMAMHGTLLPTASLRIYLHAGRRQSFERIAQVCA